jgi:hypothetical protein
MVTLRKVLDYFETSRECISLDLLASELDLPEGQLESMLDFWVRKGRLRLSSLNSAQCGSCGKKSDGCYIIGMPQLYELVK